MKKDIRVWLVTTDHLEEGLWFREEEDFKVGMNYVATLAAEAFVSILAFILMSNHVHFVLVGTEEDARELINEFKRRFAQYLQSKYGTAKFLKRNRADVRAVPSEDEAIERAIAYVMMNCVAANICAHPTQYRWGSGSLYFNEALPGGIRADSCSKRKLFNLLHSKAELPGHWLLSEDGYVLPASYVNKDWVEKLYRNPSRMEYFLRNSSKARRRLEPGSETQASFRDQTILAAVPELCRSLFGTPSFQDLSEEQQKEVLRQLRFRFSAHVHQLARVVGLSYDAAARMLDSQ